MSAFSRSGLAGVSLLLVMFFGYSVATQAGNGGYFVTYNHHLEKGEREVMVMFDYTRPSATNREEGQDSYFSQMVELEWVVTDQFATELMLEGFEEPGGQKKFTGFRWENRYRLFKNEVPLNPVLYMEYEHLDYQTRFKMETSGWIHPPYPETEREGRPKDERILETRLVLSQDFGSTNVAFNWINETDLRTGRTDFGYATGVMHYFGHGEHHHHSESSESDAHEEAPESEGGYASGIRLAAIGAELWGALGDDRKLDLSPSRQQHYLGPVVMFHLGKKWMMHLSPTFGLSEASDDMIVRFALGYEF